MRTKILSRIIQAFFPSVRRRAEEAQKKANIRNMENARLIVVEHLSKLRAQKADEDHKRQCSLYDRHIGAYNLNGIGSRSTNGVTGSEGDPITISDLAKAVRERISLAAAVAKDTDIKRSSAEDVTTFTGGLNHSDLRGILDHEDADRQREAADNIRDVRLRFDPEPTLWAYATAVAEAAAAEKHRHTDEGGKLPEWTADVVCARAILLRSVDYRWSKRDRSALRPLHGLPLRSR
jgi:hypothetical protein